MRKAVLLLGLVSLATCVAVTTWAAATPGLYVQMVADRDSTTNAITGNLAARVSVIGIPTAREVVFHLSFPTVYGVNITASDIRIVAVKPGADVMSIDANNPPTGVLTPVVFAEGVTSTVREVWVVALLTSSANDPKAICDVVFTAHGRPTLSNVAIDSVQVKDGSLTVQASTANFSANSGGTTAGVACPIFGDFNWDGHVSAADFAMWVAAWKAWSASNTTASYADIMPAVSGDTPTDPANCLTDQSAALAVSAIDFAGWVAAWKHSP